MFGSIFKEVTSYFDRHALVSAFAPTLVLWAVVIGLSLFLSGHWQTTFGWIKGANAETNVTKPAPTPAPEVSGQPPRAGVLDQIFLFLSFLAFVVFTSFLLLNFQASLVRLYSGLVPEIRVLSSLLERNRRKWQERFTANIEFLRQSRDETRILKRVIDGKWNPFDGLTEKPPQPADLSETYYRLRFRLQLQKFLRLGRRLSANEIGWGYYVAGYYGVKNASSSKSLLVREAEYRLAITEHRMQHLDRDRFFRFPTEKEDVMPTQLGNVIRSAETYPKDRYKLDASLIWTWLEPLLPPKTIEPLNDARTSLHLMITCSSLILLVGVPFSIWAGVKYAGSWPWWTPLIPAAVVFLFRLYDPWWFTIVLLVIVELILVRSLQTTVWLSNLHVVITLISATILVSWLFYQSTILAALSYGERYRVAFDHHRWKILEALHLQLPRDFEEECRIWVSVGRVFFRAAHPDPYYWTYTQQANTRAMTTASSESRPVPRKDIERGTLLPENQADVKKLFHERLIGPQERWVDAVKDVN